MNKRIELAALHRDGREFPVEFTISAVHLPDGYVFNAFVRDITERKQLEKESLDISEREQRRIGQDLHDGLCSQLAAIRYRCQFFEEQLRESNSTHAPTAAKIAAQINEAITEARHLARGLHPVVLVGNGLMLALESLAKEITVTTRVPCQFRCTPPVLVNDDTAVTHLYRIAQEAVRNAIQHGQPNQVRIELTTQDHTLTLTVTDDGRGISADRGKAEGMGLLIMQHRASVIGGSLDVQRLPAGGTRVACSVSSPLKTERSATILVAAVD